MHTLRILTAALLLSLLLGCATGGNSRPQPAPSSGGDVLTETAEDIAATAGREAVHTTKDNVRRGVRDAVNETFKDVFKK